MPGRSAYTSFGRFLVFSWRVLGRTSVLVLGGVRLFLPAFKPIPKNTWSRLFLYSSVPVQNKLEKYMSEQKIDVTIHDDNWGCGGGCVCFLIFWITIMFLLSLLKAFITLASWFFIACLGGLGLLLLVGVIRKHGSGCECCLIGEITGKRMFVKGIGLALFAISLTLIVYYLVFVPEINAQILNNTPWWKKIFGNLELKPEYTFLPPRSWPEAGILLMGMLGLIGSFIPLRQKHYTQH